MRTKSFYFHTTRSKKNIIEAIINFHSKHGIPPKGKDFNSDNDLPGTSTVIEYFGTMNEAILAAGFIPESSKRQNGFKYSDEEMIRSVRSIAIKIGHLPTITEWDKRRDAYMPTRLTYKLRFKKWHIVLRKTGLKFSITRYILRDILFKIAGTIMSLARYFEQPASPRRKP
ncbi:MAG: hypothetical protein ABSA44_09770 [Bacteroidota bacterium]|jgi:hypothetical protein